MNSADKLRSGKPSKQAQIVENLRADIMRGELKPGEALPGQLTLSRRFGVSPMTVMLALRQMAGEGYLHTEERVGTFVARHLPYLVNYALVFPFDPAVPDAGGEPSWSKYYQAITTASVELQRQLGPRMTIFHGIGYHADSEDRQRLADRIRSHRLAGIMFASSPHDLIGTPILDEPGIPRVALTGEQQQAHVSAITFDNAQWLDKALNLLRQRGRRRVAVLFNAFSQPLADRLNRSVEAHKMVCPPCWQQAPRWNDQVSVSHCIQLLMRGPAADRPDGLLIMDDNLVEGVTTGLVASGIRVPDELEVVAHTNYPLMSSPVLPFHQLGYDLGAALRKGLDLIDAQRRGEPVAGLTVLPAVWRQDLVVTEEPRVGVLAEDFSAQSVSSEVRSKLL